MQSKEALIVFVKNPVLGKVKTRIANKAGDAMALEIYKKLLLHTQEITTKVKAEKYVFYSDFIDEKDGWANLKFNQKLQDKSSDLGIKMACAFRDLLREGHERICIIGSDCFDIDEEIINKSFDYLADNEVVIGEATDGGYYLIGFDFKTIGERCAEVLKRVFYDKEWSHEAVAKEAIDAFENQKLKYKKLPVLTDIDEYEDYLRTFNI